MQIPGYTPRGKVDEGWWMGQVQAAKDERKEQAHENSWDTWRKYYQGRWAQHILPVNIFFSMLRMTVPRIYFRNPSVSVIPAMPGMLNMAFAQVLNRVDNKMLDQMNIKREIKRMVQYTFMFGTSAGKCGFGSEYAPTPAFPIDGPPEGRSGERWEYHPDVHPDMPWFQAVHPSMLIKEPEAKTWEGARWAGIQITRPIHDIKNNKAFDSKARQAVVAIRRDTYGKGGRFGEVDVAELVEIRDRQTGNVLVFSPYSDREGHTLYYGPDELQGPERFPLFPLVFNEEDDQFWGTPDSKILEPYQLELNEIRTQTMKHRRLALVKLLMRVGAIDESEIAKMLSEDVAAVVQTNVEPRDALEKMLVADIPQSLILAEREVMQDIRETVGFSRNTLGEFQPGSEKPTAREVATVHAATELRIDERKDMVADVLTSFVQSMNDILFKRWDGEQIVDIVGPGGAQTWVRFNPAQLRMGRYTVRVDPDSTSPKTRGTREARAAQIYEIFKANPLIDPVKLTQYLLHEIEGVQMDDLMRAMPANEGGAGGTPGRALDMGGLAQMMQRQMAQVPARAGRG